MFNVTQEELKTVWYLSTLGSNSKIYRKVNKSNVMTVSIPKACALVTDPSINLRMSSSLLYGISLLYKLKTNYFMNDLHQMNTQIKFWGTQSVWDKKAKSTSIAVEAEGGYGGVETVFGFGSGLGPWKQIPQRLLLSDDHDFIIDDLVPEFSDPIPEVEAGRRIPQQFVFPNFDRSEFGDDTEIVIPELGLDDDIDNAYGSVQDLNFDLHFSTRTESHVESTMNLDLDFNFDVSGKNTPSISRSASVLPNEEPLETNEPERNVSVANESGLSDAVERENNEQQKTRTKRMFLVVEDDELKLRSNFYKDFEQNYEALMEIERYKKLMKQKPNKNADELQLPESSNELFQTVLEAPTTPEAGRRMERPNSPQSVLDGNEFDQFDYSNRNTIENETTSSQPFELSFPDLDRDIGSSSHNGGDTETNELELLELNKFYNYLHNLQNDPETTEGNSTRINFSTICPLKCKRGLVVKSFAKILELATNDLVHIDTTESGFFQLMKYDQTVIALK